MSDPTVTDEGAGAQEHPPTTDGGGAAQPVEEHHVDGDLAALDQALAADPGPEPRRHWLRYPGLVGALAVVAMAILVPCGGGLLFFNGAFADHGRYQRAPDACTRLGSEQVRAAFGPGLRRTDSTTGADGSTCTYQGGGRGPFAMVRMSLTSYGTKGPLSAPQVAHVGLDNDVSDQVSQGGSRGHLRDLGDEAVELRHAAGVIVYARFSNLVLRLDAQGEGAEVGKRTIAAARAIGATLR